MTKMDRPQARPTPAPGRRAAVAAPLLLLPLWLAAISAVGPASAAAEPKPAPGKAAPAAKPAAAAPAAPAAAPVAAAAALAPPPGAPAGEPEKWPAGALFAARCMSCHTIGEGVKVGPDLMGVTERRDHGWLRKFLTSPTAMIEGKDPIVLELLAKHNNVRMPEQNFQPGEIDSLLAFFQACGKKQGGCRPVPANRLGWDGTPEEIALGQGLFSGKMTFARGGPACFACHAVRGVGLLGGGTLGGDLTFAMARLTDAGVSERMLASPLERSVYRGKELTELEAFAVKAYLASLSRDGTWSPPDPHFFSLGVLGFLAVLGAVGIAWLAGRGEGGGAA